MAEKIPPIFNLEGGFDSQSEQNIIVSKFIKVAQGVTPNTSGQPAQSGTVPSVLPAQNTTTPTAAVPVAKPQMTNYFVQAGLNPQQYVGTAEQNEKLRRVIDPSARTFYDAYVKKFGKWAQHPNERINNLSGGFTPKTPQTTQGQAQGAPNAQGQTGVNQNPGQTATAYPPLPEGFQRSQSGIVIPPLPR